MQKSRNHIELMTFRVGGQLLGIDIESIKEINCHLKIVPAPVPNPSVLGVINLRGDVLTVLDLGALIGLSRHKSSNLQDKFIVLRSDDERIALSVDRLEDVTSVASSDIQPLPSNFKTDYLDAYKGLVKKDFELLLVLNADAIPHLPIHSVCS